MDTLVRLEGQEESGVVDRGFEASVYSVYCGRVLVVRSLSPDTQATCTLSWRLTRATIQLPECASTAQSPEALGSAV